MPEYAELWLVLRFSASLHQPPATSGPETVREIDMRRMSKLPNTETDIFEWSSHAWSWRVFGRSVMVIFIDKTSHVGISMSMDTVVMACVSVGRGWWFSLLNRVMWASNVHGHGGLACVSVVHTWHPPCVESRFFIGSMCGLPPHLNNPCVDFLHTRALCDVDLPPHMLASECVGLSPHRYSYVWTTSTHVPFICV